MGALQKFASLFFRVRPETRSGQVSTADSMDKFERFFGIPPLMTAVPVTESTAMQLSAVYSCVRVISEDLATLPIGVFRESGESRKPFPKHPAHRLLRQRPNGKQTPFRFKEYMYAVALLWGNSHARIIRNGLGDPVELKTYGPGECYAFEYGGKVWYNTPDGVLPDYDVFHLAGLGFDGLQGKSPIRMQAESIGVALAAQQYGGQFFKNGAHVTGILSTDAVLEKKSREAAKEQFNAGYSGMENAGKTAILDGGLKYTRIGVPPEEAQFLETRKYSREEIAGMYRVAPHLIGNNDHSTFSNIEHQSTDHVTQALMPWAKRFEEEADRKLVDEADQGTVYTRFNVNARLRGDVAARTTHYKEMWHIGLYSHNDIRRMEDQNPVDGGDERYIQMQYVPLSKVGEMVDSTIKKNATPAPGPQNTSNGKGTESNDGK